MFSPEQQFKIIKQLCDLDQFSQNAKVKDLKIKLITRYGHLNPDINAVNEVLIDETRHWLNNHNRVLSLYQSASR